MARDDVTGVLLVGGASRRFGSPKALARLDGETLAERGYRTLAAAFATVLAVGKADDALPLPFRVEDDGSDIRAPIVGVVAALRIAPHDLVVVLPTDMPFVTPAFLGDLAEAAAAVDAAHPPTGPLPGAYSASALPVLETRVGVGELALHRALADLRTRVVEGAPEMLRNVNRPEDLERA